MRSAQSSEERGVAEIGRNAESDEDHAKDNSGAEIEFDERADEVKAEEKDQGSRDRREKRAVLAKEGANCAGRGAERNKNDGKAGNECERRSKQAGARNLALAELLHADAGEHGDVAGNERQNTGRKKRNEPGEKSSC